MEPNIKQINYEVVHEDIKIQQQIKEMKTIESFISDFGFLSDGRDYVLCDKWSFSLQSIITSVELTAGNIIQCCENGCLADGNALLRKYRDDLFFYLYIAIFDSNQKLGNVKKSTEMGENISRWVQNGLNNLYINDVLRAIGTSPQLKEAVAIYKLQKSFDVIGERLNDFLHGNGIAYYNRNIFTYKNDDCYIHIKRLANDMKYITVTFLFLLILCSPLSVMATDYIDYLDYGETPPKGSQYWIAPFVERFILGNINLIDVNCYRYLKESTNMEFDSYHYQKKGDNDV